MVNLFNVMVKDILSGTNENSKVTVTNIAGNQRNRGSNYW